MTQIQQNRSDAEQTQDSLRIKRPISERKLQANRVNAKRSTGPRSAAGKAASRRNALKHGILSNAIVLRSLTPSCGAHSFRLDGSIGADSLLMESGSQEIHRIWDKMARVLILERDSMQRPDGFEQNARLVHRYERMLSGQLHERIRQQGQFPGKNRKNIGRSL